MGYNNVDVMVSGPNKPSSTYKTKILKGNHDFASQVTEANMKYVVKYDFDLNGETITIPTNCILEFDGGSLINGTVIGNKTCIEAGLIKIFNTDITLVGTWNIGYAYPQWFGIMPGDSTKDSSSFLKMMCSLSINTYWCNGNWYFSPTIINGAHNFSIIGEGQLRTFFRLFNPTKNASYIIKFGGKEDFSEFIDSDSDYHTYYTTNFIISGITFYEKKGELVNYNPNDGDLKYAAVVFDACAEGTVNLEFTCYDPAIYIRTTWEMMFEKLYVYYGGKDNDNFNIPKITIGSAPRGSSVNACTFIDIKGEALNGAVIKTMPSSKLSHCVINNFFYEWNGIVSNNYPNRILSDDFITQLNDYVKNNNYDIWSIIDFTEGKIDISIGTISLDGQSYYNQTSTGKPLVRTIFSINTDNFIGVSNINIIQAAINGFIYLKSKNTATGSISIGEFCSRSSKNTDYGYNKSLIILSDNYQRCNIKSVEPINVFRYRNRYSVVKDFDIMNIVKLNKYYENKELEYILYNGANANYRQSNIVPNTFNGAFSINEKIAIYTSKATFKLPRIATSFNIVFDLYNTVEEITGAVIQETYIRNGTEGFYQNIPITVISLGENHCLVKAIMTSHSDGLTMLSKVDQLFRINGFIVTLNEN